MAENTTRYLNVLSLLQETLPLIVYQMVAVKMENNDFGLFFTKVLDYIDEDKRIELIEEKNLTHSWLKYYNQEQYKVFNSLLELTQNISKKENWNRHFKLHFHKKQVHIKSDDCILLRIVPAGGDKIHLWSDIFYSDFKSESVQKELKKAQQLKENPGGMHVTLQAVECDSSILEYLIKESYKNFLNKKGS